MLLELQELQRDNLIERFVCTVRKEWKHLNMDGCVPIHTTYNSASNAWAIASIVIAGVGFAIEGTSIAIFVIHFNNRIIRAASRELTAVLLVGMFFCYLVPFIYIVKPSLIICGVRRFVVGFGFSSCFSPVLVKTVRIHRIFNQEASATSLRYMYVNPLSQVTFTAVLIPIQVYDLIGMVAWEWNRLLLDKSLMLTMQ